MSHLCLHMFTHSHSRSLMSTHVHSRSLTYTNNHSRSHTSTHVNSCALTSPHIHSRSPTSTNKHSRSHMSTHVNSCPLTSHHIHSRPCKKKITKATSNLEPFDYKLINTTVHMHPIQSNNQSCSMTTTSLGIHVLLLIEQAAFIFYLRAWLVIWYV